MKASVAWRNKMRFEAQACHHTFTLDTTEKYGGENLGPSPKALTLVSLAGCTAMDVISILSKKKATPELFEVHADAVIARDHPQRIEEITITYTVNGAAPQLEEKVKRAVYLSITKYCGVYATLAPAVKLCSRIIVNGVELPPDADPANA